VAGRRKTAAKVNIPICLAGILFCLTLFSFHLSSGVVARYSATSSGSDSARVIEFGALRVEIPEEDTNGATQYIYPGAQLKCNPKVYFDGSESATYVFIEVTGAYQAQATGIIPVKILESKTSSEAQISEWTPDFKNWTSVEGHSNVYCYKGDGDKLPLPPNTQIDGVYLFDKTNDRDISKIVDTVTADQLKEAKFSIEYKAYAVQSNGFDSVKDAWESVSKH